MPEANQKLKCHKPWQSSDLNLILIVSFRGRVIKELGLRRTDLVITTKLFWGPRTGPNDRGLSRKQ